MCKIILHSKLQVGKPCTFDREYVKFYYCRWRCEGMNKKVNIHLFNVSQEN